ncbi:MAG: hypothetical protein D4R92_00160 [Actinobacteria bacterium]|nr:MAG: hypothetical protein D4R92_00160 [Actinomycetota bacterium]
MVIGVCASLLLVALPVRLAYAIEGGESALGENVISILFRTNGRINQACSGTVIEPRLIVTAKHCFPLSSSEPVLGNISEISFPGVEFNQNIGTSKALKLITTPGAYTVNSDDLAIVVTASDLPVLGNIRLATKEDIERFRTTNPTVITYGYGSNALSLSMQTTPLKMRNKFVPNRNNLPNESFTIEYISPTTYLCGGDSGGPSFVLENDTMVYVGPTSSSNREGCASGKVGTFTLNGTALAYSTELLETAKQAVLEAQQLEESKKKEDAEIAAKASMTKKKSSLICVKASTVKKVIGEDPKCPSGFKIRK